MDNALSHGLWAVTAPPAPVLPAAEGGLECDVAVVGGGYTGLSAALHLAEAGADTLLLEARHIGYGGAGRNVGLVNAGLWLMPDDVVQIVGPEHGERLVEVLGASPDKVFGLIEKHGFDCEAVRVGTLHCAHSRAGYRVLGQREAQWLRRGAPVRLLDRDEAAGKIGSRAFHGALLDRRAGTVQPLAYAYGLAGAAAKAGARLFERSPVTGIRRNGQHWHLTTSAGRVRAGAVILAVQGYPEHAFRDQERSLVPFNFFQFATAPLPAEVRDSILPGGQGAWDTALVLSSFRLDRAGRLMVGSVGQVEGGAWSLHEKWARRTLAKVFPQVGAVSFEHGWWGRIAMTPDHVPRFHVLDRGLAMVTGYNGRGIGPGTVFGQRLAEYTLTGNPEVIPLPCSPPGPIRFRGLRGLFYEAGARLYHFVQRRLF